MLPKDMKYLKKLALHVQQPCTCDADFGCDCRPFSAFRAKASPEVVVELIEEIEALHNRILEFFDMTF